ncbi:MAG: NADH-quinone oxidoreductase subunit NuoK [Deltaproteobacteria bacterium]|nr:NADH-quinone oxidoreductase subunit NuoK [Deltaproteobacteria bacterium]
MTLAACLFLSAALFCIGVFGLVTRRHAIGLLLSIELMANAAIINFVAFSRFGGGPGGQVFAIFAVALTVAEVVVGLAIVLLLYRTHRDVQVDLARDLKH